MEEEGHILNSGSPRLLRSRGPHGQRFGRDSRAISPTTKLHHRCAGGSYSCEDFVALLTAKQQHTCGIILEQDLDAWLNLQPIWLLYRTARSTICHDNDNDVRRRCERHLDGNREALFAASKKDLQPRRSTRPAGPEYEPPCNDDDDA